MTGHKILNETNKLQPTIYDTLRATGGVDIGKINDVVYGHGLNDFLEIKLPKSRKLEYSNLISSTESDNQPNIDNIDFLQILGYNKESLEFNQTNHVKIRGRPKKSVNVDGIFVHYQNQQEDNVPLSSFTKKQIIYEFNLMVSDDYTGKIIGLSEKYEIPYKQCWNILEHVL